MKEYKLYENIDACDLQVGYIVTEQVKLKGRISFQVINRTKTHVQLRVRGHIEEITVPLKSSRTFIYLRRI